MPETRPEEVFVSYSRQDNEKVLALTGRLREAGVGLWMNVRNIDGATMWGEEIVNAVAKSKVLLLLVQDGGQLAECGQGGAAVRRHYQG